LAIGLE